jgi:hypothetical protein
VRSPDPPIIKEAEGVSSIGSYWEVGTNSIRVAWNEAEYNGGEEVLRSWLFYSQDAHFLTDTILSKVLEGGNIFNNNYRVRSDAMTIPMLDNLGSGGCVELNETLNPSVRISPPTPAATEVLTTAEEALSTSVRYSWRRQPAFCYMRAQREFDQISQEVLLSPKHLDDTRRERLPFFIAVASENGVGLSRPSPVAVISERCSTVQFKTATTITLGTRKRTSTSATTGVVAAGTVCRPCPTGADCSKCADSAVGCSPGDIQPNGSTWTLPWTAAGGEVSSDGELNDGHAAAIRRARSIVGPGMATCKAARCTINRKTNRTCGDTGVVNMTTAKFNSGGIGIGNNSDTTTSAVTSVDDCRCEEGYEGFLCSRCSDGWTREAWDTTGSGTCSRCPADASLNRLSLAAGALVLILGIIIFIYQTIKDKGEEDFVGVVMCKILFSHLQIISLVQSFPLEWPPEILILFKGPQAISSAAESLVNIDCEIGSNAFSSKAYIKALLIALLPIVVGIVVWAWWAVFALYRAHVWDPLAAAAAERDRAKARAIVEGILVREPADGARVSLLVIFFLIHSTLTGVALQLFSCEKVPDLSLSQNFDGICAQLNNEHWKHYPRKQRFEKELRMHACLGHINIARINTSATEPPTTVIIPEGLGNAARRGLCRWDKASSRGWCRPGIVSYRLLIDPTIECYTSQADGTHFQSEYMKWALGLGGPMILLYTIGIPVTMLVLLRRGKHLLEVLKPVYGFLFAGFARKVYYWEILIFARKTAILAVAVILVPAGADVQAYVALIIIAASLQLQIRHKPYLKEYLNKLERDR